MSHEYVLKPFTPEIRLNIDYPRELNEQQHAAVIRAVASVAKTKNALAGIKGDHARNLPVADPRIDAPGHG